jgi:outer membrane protein assembly factor BamA
MVVPVRGYRYFSDTGSRFALVNAEFRYPFIDYFKLHFPLPIGFSQIGGAIFWDMGASWNKSDDSKFFDTLRFRNPRELEFSENGTDGGTVLAGFGFGPRANLGLFVLRIDVAWSTNLDYVSHKPDWYFSFGSEF